MTTRIPAPLSRLFLAAAAIFLVSATQPMNWLTQERETDGGYEIGNPDAPLKLTEWVSYTCPACARFTIQGEGAIKLAYILPGKMKVEMRHLIRDPVDLTAATLAHCGDASRFPSNNAAFMHRQAEWLPRMRNASQGQKDRWNALTGAAQRRALADAMGFYAIMETQGYSRVETDRCLADEAKVAAIEAASAADDERFTLQYTPSFTFDDEAPAFADDWDGLHQRIETRLSTLATP
jgi:protein-disulfide isomerase